MKKRQVPGPCQRTKKAVEHECDGDTSCNWHTWNCPQRLGKEVERVGNQKMNQEETCCHSDWCEKLARTIMK